MYATGRAAAALVAGSVLLSGCSVLGLAPETHQSVVEACATFDNKKLAAAGKTLEKAATGSVSPKAAGSAIDSFTKVFEDRIDEVENPDVQLRAQLASISMRNFGAELRTFKPTQRHRDAVKADFAELKRQLTKLSKLCEWA
ncbi:MAG: hypothetical protein CVT65_01665 [Actinobacteria bacterium HGW-Actinobacteria-5]|jgi:hypothetical protein|nr:MAG: hypothetical protein CVT65_01665 [Actinobacteria bacterium HGW-Actinobacteria-5]